MPEAVIVATARSPIGRAGKGSLVSIRPDDLSAQIVTALLDKVPQLPARPDRGPDHGLRAAGRRGRVQHRPRRRRARRARRRARRDGQPLLLVEPADDPHGRPRHQGRRGRRVHRRRRRDRQPLRRRGQRHGAERRLRRRRRAHGRAGARWRRPTGRRRPACPTSTSPWARRPRTSSSSSTSPARRWTSSPSCSQDRAVANIENGFFADEITPVTLPDGTVVSTRRRAACRHDARGPGPAQAGVPPRRHDHRRQRLPAQRRRRRRARDERHQGRRARPHAAGPHRVLGRHRPQPRDHGPRPDRGQPPGAAPGPA